MSWFNKCKHDWETLVDKFIESNVVRLSNSTSGKQEFRYLASDLSGTNIVILRCTKCGEIDKTITRT